MCEEKLKEIANETPLAPMIMNNLNKRKQLWTCRINHRCRTDPSQREKAAVFARMSWLTSFAKN